MKNLVETIKTLLEHKEFLAELIKEGVTTVFNYDFIDLHNILNECYIKLFKEIQRTRSYLPASGIVDLDFTDRKRGIIISAINPEDLDFIYDSEFDCIVCKFKDDLRSKIYINLKNI